MIARVRYIGLHPLGSEMEINSVKIMQAKWKHLKKPMVFMFSKGQGEINPLFCHVYAAEENEKIAYFAADEYMIGKYHIFEFLDKSVQKLNKSKKKFV